MIGLVETVTIDRDGDQMDNRQPHPSAVFALRVLMTLMLAIGPTLSGAATVRAQVAPPPPRAPRTLEAPTVPPLPGLEPSAVESPSELERIQTDMGKYAFQNYADNNWEIYLATSDYGDSTVRLTREGAADLEPALSPDMSRVVFTSRRSGNYDLFRVNADGNGLAMLTNHGATDSGAAWSPDSQRIAFQSNREADQYDVYVMNADGGNVTRLTTQAGYDGEPAWSPDGKQIAFVSRRTTGEIDYYLYVMNADGSNQHILTAVPYSSNPTWSWDGKRILIDGLKPDGWQGLYVVDATTGQTRTLDPFPGDTNTDVIAGSWGLNDQIYFTRAHYVLYNNAWYWDSMVIYSLAIDMTLNNPWQRLGNRAANPSWANPDHLPPTSTFLTPQFGYLRRGTGASFQMIVIDQGTAGGAGGTGQIRVDGGPWRTGDVSCSPIKPMVVHCYVMGFFPGSLLEYRFSGFDNFYNQEAWPTDPARWGQLRYYDLDVSGTVVDQTGRPLALVPVTGIPAVEPSIQTDADGYWTAHQIQPGTDVTVTVGAGGSALARPETEFDAAYGAYSSTFVLPPTDNVIANPRFEVDTQGWSALAAAGVQWVDTVDTHHGVMRVSASKGDWAVSGTVVTATAALSGTSTLLAYRDSQGNHFQACQGIPGCQSEDLGQTLTRDFVVAPNGTVSMILMNDDGSRSFSQRSPSGVWSSTTVFPYQGGGASHRLLYDHAGHLHYVWAEGDGMVHVAHYEGGGNWSGASQAGLMQLGSDYVFDADDVLHMVGCRTSGVVEVTWSEAVGMSSPSTVSSETCDGFHQGTSIDVAGHIDTLWSSGGVVRFSRRNGDGTWGATQPATGLVQAARGNALGANGRATVLTIDPNTHSLTLRQPADSGLGWSPLVATLPNLTADSGRRFLALNPAANVALMLESTPGGFKVVAYPLDFVEATSSVGQVVTLPANGHHPLLTGVYRNPWANIDDTVALAVQAAGQAQPTLYALSPGLAWQRVAFDLSAWVGQTITISVNLADGGTPNELAVDFDELYAGSWSTPVVESVSPAQVDTPGGSFSVVGENFYGAPTVTVDGLSASVALVDAEHLNVTTPSGLAYGRHVVFVTNPDGTTSAAPTLLVIGQYQLAVPVLLRNSVR